MLVRVFMAKYNTYSADQMININF